MNFAELGLSPNLLAGIAKLGFETPTPVQAEVIPFLLNHHDDVVALAQTGTGKTAAFGLPILESLNPDSVIPQALILCPTRELCMQITRDLENFAAGMSNIKLLAVYGGADIRRQLTALQRGVHIIVATPGRMMDILRRRSADLSSIERVVLDEADEMLNMGFEEDLKGILSETPDTAQTLLFSATMPKAVARIAGSYMHKPHEITLGTRNAVAANVVHDYYVVHAKDRYAALRRIADAYPDMYGIVFCRTRMDTQQVADWLRKDGYHAEPLHGDLSQQQRSSVMQKLRDHSVNILVATDVAARGLDVNDLTHIINYQLPDDLAAYTHRSGRTGRAGKHGISVSIIHMREHYKINRLQKTLGVKFNQQDVPTGDTIIGNRLRILAERLQQDDLATQGVEPHLETMTAILKDLPKNELIKRFASLQCQQLLAHYHKAQDLNVEPSEPTKQSAKRTKAHSSTKDNRQRQAPRNMTEGMTELVMNVGKINGMSRKKLKSMITDLASEIGRINIVKMQTYFEVPKATSQAIINHFATGDITFAERLVGVAQAGNSDFRPKTKRSPAGHKRSRQPASPSDRPRKRGRGQGGKAKKRR